MEFIQYCITNNLLKPGEVFPFKISQVKLKKGTKISNIGEVEKNIYFLVSGKIEAGMITSKSNKILGFAFENGFFCSATSMLKKEPSDVYHKCIANCVVQVIPYDELIKSCEKSLIANRLFIHFLVLYYLDSTQKRKDPFIKSTKEQFKSLSILQPQLLQEVSMAKIAKYLNIHPYSLSRIRGEIIKEEKKKNKK